MGVRASRDSPPTNPFAGPAAGSVGLPAVAPQGTHGFRLCARLHVARYSIKLSPTASAFQSKLAKTVTGQSRRVGRVCPQRAGPRSRKYGGALRTDAPYPPLLLRHYKQQASHFCATFARPRRRSRSAQARRIDKQRAKRGMIMRFWKDLSLTF